MAQGSFYKGGLGQPNDTLDRVAFKLVNDDNRTLDYLHFAVNPSQMTYNHQARNVFIQTARTVGMQGFGQGLHTIQIQGQTGFTQAAVMDNGPTGEYTNYARYKHLERIIMAQLNNAHDTGEPNQMTTLYFMNYTDGGEFRVELDQQGIQFSRSNQDPLSYYYSIDMVVIAPASMPNNDESTVALLGNAMSHIAQRPYKPRPVLYSGQTPHHALMLGALYSHPLRKHDDLTLAHNAEHGLKSVADEYPGVNANTIEDKGPTQGKGGMPNETKSALLDSLNQKTGPNPVMHVTDKQGNPLFNVKLPTIPSPIRRQFFNKWIGDTSNFHTTNLGI